MPGPSWGQPRRTWGWPGGHLGWLWDIFGMVLQCIWNHFGFIVFFFCIFQMTLRFVFWVGRHITIFIQIQNRKRHGFRGSGQSRRGSRPSTEFWCPHQCFREMGVPTHPPWLLGWGSVTHFSPAEMGYRPFTDPISDPFSDPISDPFQTQKNPFQLSK